MSDIDPEEVRRCIGAIESDLIVSDGPYLTEVQSVPLRRIVEVARDWLRLREQPAPAASSSALAEENEDLDAAVTRERERVVGIFVVELQKLHEKTVLDCGDNSCLFATRRGGMRTNGGCRCIERLLDAAAAREREACAQIVEEWKRPGARVERDRERNDMLDDVADEIRARSRAKGV